MNLGRDKRPLKAEGFPWKARDGVRPKEPAPAGGQDAHVGFQRDSAAHIKPIFDPDLLTPIFFL